MTWSGAPLQCISIIQTQTNRSRAAHVHMDKSIPQQQIRHSRIQGHRVRQTNIHIRSTTGLTSKPTAVQHIYRASAIQMPRPQSTVRRRHSHMCSSQQHREGQLNNHARAETNSTMGKQVQSQVQRQQKVKGEIMLITRKRKVQPPTAYLNGQLLKVNANPTYLGARTNVRQRATMASAHRTHKEQSQTKARATSADNSSHVGSQRRQNTNAVQIMCAPSARIRRATMERRRQNTQARTARYAPVQDTRQSSRGQTQTRVLQYLK